MDIESYKVDELKAELKKRGCAAVDLRGKKADLVLRLSQLMESEKNILPSAENVASESLAISSATAITEVAISNGSDVITDSLSDRSGKLVECREDTPSEEILSNEEITANLKSTEQTEAFKGASLEETKLTESKSRAQKMAELKAKAERVRDIEAPTGTPSCHVRIDNFIRPLTNKVLLQWLQARLGDSAVLLPDDIWVNSIKTHCYVTLPSILVAEMCIKAVNGLRWPEGSVTNNSQLHADFTMVAAASAECSQEAQLKPGSWKDAATLVVGSEHLPDSSLPPQTLPSSSSLPVVRGRGSAHAGIAGVLMKAVAASARDVPIPLAQKAVNPQARTVHSIPSKRERDSGDAEQNVSKKLAPAKVLEDLFRKTVATPHLYWLPVPEHVVRKRILDTRDDSTRSKVAKDNS